MEKVKLCLPRHNAGYRKSNEFNKANALNNCYNVLNHEDNSRLRRQAKFHEDSPFAQGDK